MSLQPVLTFDGIDDYIEIPYSEKHNPKVFTISCWVKNPHKEGRHDVVISTENNSRNRLEGYFLQIIQAKTTYEWRFYAAGPKFAYGPSTTVINTWTHLAGTFDGSKLKFYVNGRIVREAIGTHVVNTQGPLHIGASYNGTKQYYFFTGQIAEVCIWNKARTEQEIQADMNKRLTGKEPGLVGYWPLNEGSGNIATDKTGNGKNGIIKGGATWTMEESPFQPVSGQFKVKTNSSTAVFVFANKQAKEVKYKFTPSTDTWNPDPNKGKEFTAQGIKGLPDAEQKVWGEQLEAYKGTLKYPEKSPYALIAQLVSINEKEEENNETDVIEVGQETEIILGQNKALIFSVNDYVTEYSDNTGTLTVKWEALN